MKCIKTIDLECPIIDCKYLCGNDCCNIEEGYLKDKVPQEFYLYVAMWQRNFMKS